MQACEGDCDSDSDCAGGLKCFQRSDREAVPGCDNNGDVAGAHDFCYAPFLVNFGVDGKANMQACEGDCDSDSDCAGSLKCYQRENRESVPGCANNANVPKQYDFCYAAL